MISAHLSSIHPPAATNCINVVHEVSSLGNSAGFHDGSAPFAHCSAMPMAVGYSATQVNASVFGLRQITSCHFLSLIPSVGWCRWDQHDTDERDIHRMLRVHSASAGSYLRTIAIAFKDESRDAGRYRSKKPLKLA